MAGEILAALATIPGRERLLPRVLSFLRPQVSRLCVYLNGHREVPACVRELADDHVLAPENHGAERKFHWAAEHDGIYLSCDDDLGYPPDYAVTMAEAVRRWDGQAIVSAHGRAYPQRPTHVHNVIPQTIGIFYQRIREGRWVNHAGTGVMAWDARNVRMPTDWPDRNLADMQVAVWAQRQRVPIWLLPHKAQWVRSLSPMDPHGIFMTSRAEKHRRRNALLTRVGNGEGWRVLRIDDRGHVSA